MAYPQSAGLVDVDQTLVALVGVTIAGLADPAGLVLLRVLDLVNLLPGGVTPTLEAAFEARIGEIEGAWRDYLREINRPSLD